MIKKIAISTINIYQLLFSSFLKNILGISSMCRFEETCSAFAKRQIKNKGFLTGSALGFVRILKCQPFNS